MERKINLEGGKYSLEHGSNGLEIKRHGEAWPAADSLRYTNVVVSMYYRVVELEDRLELADRQYAGVVLALAAAAEEQTSLRCLLRAEREVSDNLRKKAEGYAYWEGREPKGPPPVLQVLDEKALQDALWVFKKESGALCGDRYVPIESAIKAYLQHGTAS